MYRNLHGKAGRKIIAGAEFPEGDFDVQKGSRPWQCAAIHRFEKLDVLIGHRQRRDAANDRLPAFVFFAIFYRP
jgi:hypothetical protein